MKILTNLSLRNKILLNVGMACLLIAVVAIVGFLHFTEKELESGIINKERTIHTQLAAATDFVAKQGGLNGVIEKYQAKYQRASQLSEQEKLEILNQVPIYAAMAIGKKNADLDRYQFRVFSNEPRRKENLASPEELEIFRKFESDPNLTEHIFNNGKLITVFKPVRLTQAQGCFSCHGDPATSPWKNGTDVLGFPMENWKEGKLHGVFAISQNVEAVVAASSEGQSITPAEWLIGAILFGAFVAILLGAVMMRGPVSALSQVAAVLAEASGEVNAASHQIADSSRELSAASSEQAASLEETAASIEEMSSMVTKNSENAKNTASSSSASREKAESGKKVVEQMMRSMAAINQSNNNIMEQVNLSNGQMAEIVKVIQEIGSRTKVINDIVFQTKLLSFNASVEAARAGEHGKGFAVVAEEVGNLAEMSGNAAKEISSMLQDSIQKVESIVQSTKAKVETLITEGKDKVAAGTEVARQCGEVLSEIVENVGRVSQMAGEISVASQEQAQGVQELTKAMNQLDQVTQQNSATSEQSAGSAEKLSAQANSLKSAVDRLIETIQGGQSAIPQGTAAGGSSSENVLPLSRSRLPLRKAELKLTAGERAMPARNHPGFEEA